MPSDDNCCNIIKLAELMTNDGAKLDFILGNLRTLEKEIDEEKSSSICKNLAASAIKKFSHSKAFQTDIRALEIWDFLARHSTSLGYGNVMERVHSNGYFAKLPQFYEKWATFLYEKGDIYKLSQVQKLAEKYCPDNAKIEEIFKKLNELSAGTDETENLIGCLPKKKDESTRTILHKKPLSVVNEESCEKSGFTLSSGSGGGDFASATRTVNDEIQQTNMINVVRPTINDTEMEEKKSTVLPQANYSFTTHLKKSEADLFGQTLPLSQEAHPVPNPSQALNIETQKDFSVFCDDNELSLSENRGQIRPHIKDLSSESPIPKKSRDLMKIDETFVKPKMLPTKLSVIDEKTVSAVHKHGDCLSSTPTKDKFTKPMFELSPTKIISKSNVVEPKKFGRFSFAPPIDSNLKTVKEECKQEIISDSMKRMSLGLDEFDHNDLETTRDYTICGDAEITSNGNPWGEKERLEILKTAPVMVEQHEFLTTKCPLFRINNVINMGGETFKIIKMIGQGGFAKVYKAENDEKKPIAIKLEMPPCPWEVYICKSVMARIDEKMHGFIMQVKDAYIFSNASAITYEYHSKNTLLELTNNSKKLGGLLDGLIVGFIGAQMANILGYIHKSKIIHSDIKPDNFVICDFLTNDEPRNQMSRPFIKLIDFGRGIDMSYFKKQTFSGRAGTESFDCIEMVEGKPWTYQTDYFGFIGTIHVLVFGSYMKYFFNGKESKYYCTESFKSRYSLSSEWKKIFVKCLNIPDCKQFPNWFDIVNDLLNNLQEYAENDIFSWKRAVTKCNDVIKTIES